MIKGLIGLTLLAAGVAEPTPSASEFKHASRQPQGTGYCKNWCVAHATQGKLTGKDGCAPAVGGVIVPQGSNAKKDKTTQHRNYCKKKCTADICGTAGVAAAAEDAPSTGAGDVAGDASGGAGDDVVVPPATDDAAGSADAGCSGQSDKGECCATPGCGFAGVRCMTAERILGNQLEDKCGAAPPAAEKTGSGT